MDTISELGLFSIIENRPDHSLQRFQPQCPTCNTKDIEIIDHSQTLIAFGNHHNMFSKCNNCGKEFRYEFKYDNCWITDKNKKLLKGIPTCFENYIYTCSKCGGNVIREYKNLDGETDIEFLKISINDGTATKQYRIFFKCTNCGIFIETNQDHF